MPIRGERMLDRYVKHPAASTVNPIANGWALDAGTLIGVDNNIHHLQEQALRPLVTSLGVGITNAYATADAVLQGAYPQADGNSLALQDWQRIPWNRQSSARFGAFALIPDYEIESGEASIRPITFQIQATIHASVTTHVFHAAVSFGRTSPYVEAPFLYDSVAFAGTGAQTQELTLVPTAAVTRTMTVGRMRCRASNVNGQTTCDPIQGYLWFGWELYGATVGGSDYSYIDSLCAWEVWS